MSARGRIVAFLVLLACCAAFVPGLGGPFLLDDFGSVVGSRPGALSFAELIDIGQRDRSGVYGRPLSTLSFALNYLAGTEPFGFKLVNLVVHLLGGIAAFVLARRLLPRLAPSFDRSTTDRAALLAAALWTIHPLQVSTVLYVVQRMAQLSGLFTFVAVAIVARWYVTVPRPPLGRAVASFVAATVLAMAAKEPGALVPLLVATFLFAAQRPLFTEPEDRRFATITTFIPLAFGAVAACFLAPRLLGPYSVRDFTLVERLLTQAQVVSMYLGLIAWPDPANMGLYHDGFPIAQVDDATSYAWAALVVVLLVGAVVARRRFPLVAFAMLWFFAAHALESTIFPLELVFEHRNYVALFGPALLVAAGAMALVRRASPGMHLLPFVLVAILSVPTIRRSSDWQSEASFIAAEAQHHPESPRAQMAAAAAALRSGQPGAAINHVRIVRKLRPDVGWSMLLDAQLACIFEGRDVDWTGIRHYFGEGNPTYADFDQLHGLTQRFLTPNGCPGLTREVATLLELARARQVALRNPTRVEELFVQSAYLARGQGDIDAAIAWLERGAAANPRGTIALFDLALVRLNAGRLDGVEGVIERLRKVARENDYPIGYQIDEIEQFLAAARAEQDER